MQLTATKQTSKTAKREHNLYAGEIGTVFAFAPFAVNPSCFFVSFVVKLLPFAVSAFAPFAPFAVNPFTPS